MISNNIINLKRKKKPRRCTFPNVLFHSAFWFLTSFYRWTYIKYEIVCLKNVYYVRFRLTLTRRRRQRKTVTLNERFATSQYFNKDDCSLKLILIFKFGVQIKAICNNNVVLCSRTNRCYRNFLEYENSEANGTILFPIGNGKMHCINHSPATRVLTICDKGNAGNTAMPV